MSAAMVFRVLFRLFDRGDFKGLTIRLDRKEFRPVSLKVRE